MEKTSLRVGALFLLVLMILGAMGIVYNVRFVVPHETISQAFWIPPNSEIQPSDKVQPGTFKIDVSLEELDMPDQKVLVVYDTDKLFINPGKAAYRRANVEYFRPHPEIAGTFQYNSMEMAAPPSKPWPDSFFTRWETSFNKENATFQYTLKKDYVVLWVSLAVVIVVGLILLVATWIAILIRRSNRASFS